MVCSQVWPCPLSFSPAPSQTPAVSFSCPSCLRRMQPTIKEPSAKRSTNPFPTGLGLESYLRPCSFYPAGKAWFCVLRHSTLWDTRISLRADRQPDGADTTVHVCCTEVSIIFLFFQQKRTNFRLRSGPFHYFNLFSSLV